MARLALQARERKLVLAASVILITWGMMTWFGFPLWDQFQTLQQQATVSGKKLARLRELVARKPLIEQQYRAYAGFWSEESDELIEGAFLDELEQLARSGQLQISVKPRPVQREGSVSRLGVEVDVDGTQAALLGFLQQLLAAPSLIELARLRVSTTVSTDRPLKGSVLVSKIVFHH